MSRIRERGNPGARIKKDEVDAALASAEEA
jgi:hypothetical protein